MSRVIVVGSGVAGLVTAILASERHDVVVVTKNELAESNTRYAQGGIAAALGPDDSPELHANDTVNAGVGMSDPKTAELVCSAGPAIIHALLGWGTVFDQVNGELARGLEAAHSRARVLHAGGDATGAAIEAALVRTVRESSVRLRENEIVVDLIMRDGRVVGVETIDAAGQRGMIDADAVVLATGGAGQLYSHTSNPEIATGDGVAAAIRAGAAATDLEFYQFHPTTLALPGNFLVSEALRGEGAVLRDAAGDRFMKTVHPDAELAPRDIVARAIARTMRSQGGLPVHLDARSIDAERLARRFPTVSTACARNGLDLAADLIPVTPAAHYWMGGIATDKDGRTSIPDLFAAGEAACTGLHGANRLASNSLLEGAVFGSRIATALDEEDTSATHGESIPEPEAARAVNVERATLQNLMWETAGLERNGRDLDETHRLLTYWAESTPASPRALTRRGVENANLLTLARAVVAAAAARRESRGAHHRTDFPETTSLPGRRSRTVRTNERKDDPPC